MFGPKWIIFALAFLFLTPLLAQSPTWHVRAHLMNGDQEMGVGRYTPVSFDSEQACKDFLTNPDERFTTATDNLRQQAEDNGLKLVVQCDVDESQ